jgi:hypothetical protein
MYYNASPFSDRYSVKFFSKEKSSEIPQNRECGTQEISYCKRGCAQYYPSKEMTH